MKNRLRIIFLFLFVLFVLFSSGESFAKETKPSGAQSVLSAQALSHLLQIARYNADLPVPNMLPEPAFTTGRTNTVFWEIDYTPTAEDSVLLFNVVAKDQMNGHSANAAQSFDKHFFTFANLTAFHIYYFQAQLIRIKKGGAAPEIGDLSPIPAVSMPDNKAPVLLNASLNNAATWKNGWTNGNVLQIMSVFRDTSGIDSTFLYLRSTPGGGWSLFQTLNFDSVYVATAQYNSEPLPDGYYEMAFTAKDNSHAPESHGAGSVTPADWKVQGNRSLPDTANLKFHVDVTPPETVSVSIQQKADVLVISWTPALDSGIGLEGYKILRNGELLATVSGQVGSFSDSLQKSLPALPNSDAIFTYRVQPFDSLGNLQVKGTGRAFHYWRKPRFYSEPVFTTGTENTVCWHPITGTDHYVLEWSGQQDFSASVHSIQVTDTCFTVTNLANGEKVFYRVKRVQPDGSETDWSDVIWSVQDQTPPHRTAFQLAELDSANFYHGWYNRSALHFSFGFQDSAGIDSVVFWEKSAVADPWQRFATKGGYDSTRVISDQFVSNFQDGVYFFYVSARDFSHSASSHGGHLQVEGNLEIPGLTTSPLAEIRIDTKPPRPVILQARQIEDKIALRWTASVDSGGGIGLKGYKIYRDGILVTELSATDTSFTDIFSSLPAKDREFTYQVEPFDSLENVQQIGGQATLWYRANPVMYAEPGRTAGTQNQVCWKPKAETATYRVQVALDSLFQNGLVTLNVTDTCLVRQFLKSGKTYFYRVKQIRADGSETGWSNVVWSTQDTVPPAVNKVRIAERDSAGWQNGWYNRNQIHIKFSLSDSSGLDSLFLYWRVDATSGWQRFLARGGLDSLTNLTDSFDQTLNDGWYEFFVSGRDHAHAAISHQNKWVVLGNRRVPLPADTAQVKIKIDTTPPSASTLTVRQLEDVIRLNWTVSKDGALGIGLAGYKIFRGDSLIATVGALVQVFNDTLTRPPFETTRIVYQIEPFDSLGNVQEKGGQAEILYKPKPRLYAEPNFTAGTRNVVCWHSDDSADHFVAQISTVPDFANHVDSLSVQDTCALFKNLVGGVRYFYRVREVRKDGGLTGWSNVVSSKQDVWPPKFQSRVIQEADSARWYRHWYPQSTIHIRFSVFDSAGVDSVTLWERNTSGKAYVSFDTQKYDSLALAEGVFTENLPDGKYGFFLSARDFAHAPESRDGHLLVKGNETVPTADSSAQLIVFIDTTPPDSIRNLHGSQTVQNVVQFQWNAAVGDAGIGVAGFHIYRNGQLVATLPVGAAAFNDTIRQNYSTVTPITYQITAFDSLGNENKKAGKRTVRFYPPVEKVTILPEPAFTAGHSNTLFWRPIYLTATYTVQCSTDSTFRTVLQEKTTTDTSATFENLEDNGLYFFRVKAVDKYQREVNWSDVVSSRQDASPPQLLTVNPLNTESINGKSWLYGSRVVQMNLSARDQADGKVAKVQIYENGTLQDSIAVVPIHALQTGFSYSLKNAPNMAIDVCVRVVDAAGNQSKAVCLTIYWEELKENIVAFPNPFNPNSGKMAVIRVKDKNVKEVWIYDYFGNLVRVLREKISAHDFLWDGKNGKGEVVGNGGYLCVIHGKKDYYKIAVLK